MRRNVKWSLALQELLGTAFNQLQTQSSRRCINRKDKAFTAEKYVFWLFPEVSQFIAKIVTAIEIFNISASYFF